MGIVACQLHALKASLTVCGLGSEAVDRAFQPHMPIIRLLHKKYCKFKSSVQQPKVARMNLQEWIGMLADANMFNDVRGVSNDTASELGLTLLSQDFTRKEAKIAFVYSKMNVVDELKHYGAWTTLSVTDMLEALARVSEMVSMPTAADLARVHVKDAFQYFKKVGLQGLSACLPA